MRPQSFQLLGNYEPNFPICKNTIVLARLMRASVKLGESLLVAGRQVSPRYVPYGAVLPTRQEEADRVRREKTMHFFQGQPGLGQLQKDPGAQPADVSAAPEGRSEECSSAPQPPDPDPCRGAPLFMERIGQKQTPPPRLFLCHPSGLFRS